MIRAGWLWPTKRACQPVVPKLQGEPAAPRLQFTFFGQFLVFSTPNQASGVPACSLARHGPMRSVPAQPPLSHQAPSPASQPPFPPPRPALPPLQLLAQLLSGFVNQLWSIFAGFMVPYPVMPAVRQRTAFAGQGRSTRARTASCRRLHAKHPCPGVGHPPGQPVPADTRPSLSGPCACCPFPPRQGWKWMNRLSPTTWTLWGLVGSQLCDRDDVQMTGEAGAAAGAAAHPA